MALNSDIGNFNTALSSEPSFTNRSPQKLSMCTPNLNDQNLIKFHQYIFYKTIIITIQIEDGNINLCATLILIN